jgi:hypothetical protein
MGFKKLTCFWTCSGFVDSRLQNADQIQNVDVPTPAIYEKCFKTPSENTLILPTALLLLSLIALGVSIAHVRSASMLAKSALKMIENDSRNTPVNQCTSISPIIQSILPNAIIY